MGISIFVLIAVIPLTVILSKGNTISAYRNQILLFLSAIIFVVINTWLLLNKKSYIWFLTVLCIEYSISGFTLYYSRMRSEGITYDFIKSATHVLQDKDHELNYFLENIEPVNSLQYYRTYIPLESIYWDFSHNMSLMVQLQGTMTYDSTYAPSFNKMKEIAPEVKDYDSEWIFNIKNPDILQFLSVKYAIVTNPSELPEGLSWRLLTDNYISVLLVYRNDDYRSLGTTYNQIITYEEIESTKLITHLSDIVACESSDLMEIQNMMNSNHSVELEIILRVPATQMSQVFLSYHYLMTKDGKSL